MGPSNIVFVQINGDAAAYVRERISNMYHAAGDTERIPTNNELVELMGAAVTDLPVMHTDLENLTGLSETTTTTYPQATGEHTVGDVAGFLATPWRGYPAGTKLLRRTTNMAVCYYVYPDSVSPLTEITSEASSVSI